MKHHENEINSIYLWIHCEYFEKEYNRFYKIKILNNFLEINNIYVIKQTCRSDEYTIYERNNE